MYLARFEGEDSTLVQAALRIAEESLEWPGPVAEVFRDWLSHPNTVASLRTRWAASAVDRTLLLSGDASLERELRCIVDAASSATTCPIEPSLNADRHDQILRAFPSRHRGAARHQGYRAGAHDMFTDFRLFSAIDSLFLGAERHGWTVAYQFNAHSRTPTKEDIRSLRKLVSRIRADDAVPSAVAELQAAIVERLPVCIAVVDECVGCDEDSAWAYLQQLVTDEFAAHLKPLSFSQPPLDVMESSDEDEWTIHGFHSGQLGDASPLEVASSAVTQAELSSMVAFSPSSCASTDQSSYGKDIFISYSNRDRVAAERTCAFLEQGSLACWIAPRDIDPAMSYPAAIMQGLRDCRVLLLLYSDNANRSPHVIREVERAVSATKPVVTLRLEDAPLTTSLEYLASLTQWIDSSNPPKPDELERIAGQLKRVIASHSNSI